MNLYKIFRPLIFKFQPEDVHNLAINYIKFLPQFNKLFFHPQHYSNLHQKLFNLDFTNPVGMSAGFDKNAEITKNLFNFGFGFVEAGTTTPQPQIGNPQPRIFRLHEDKAIINRLGFNNLGADRFYENITKINKSSQQIIGINIGKNKDTADFSSDYLKLLEKFYQCADYITINISSPNTKNLRDIQNSENLDDFLNQLNHKKQILASRYSKQTPIFLKIAPDLEINQLESIAEIVTKNHIDAVIISNTTISRNFNLKSRHCLENGGLSGKPLFEKSNEILRQFYRLTQGKITLIGVGGISSGQEAYTKIKNGASLIQIYSGFIYEGFGLVENIKKYLAENLKKDGFKNIQEAVGCNVK